MKNKKEDKKLTIYEYEQKYTKRQNVRGAKFILHIVAAALGVFIFFCLFSLFISPFSSPALSAMASLPTSAVSYQPTPSTLAVK